MVCDQLGVLCVEIEDEDFVVMDVGYGVWVMQEGVWKMKWWYWWWIEKEEWELVFLFFFVCIVLGVVVWWFFGDLYVVDVVFVLVGVVDFDEFWFVVYVFDCVVVYVVYCGVQVFYQLVDDVFDWIVVWYVVFDVFWYQFVGVGGVLEVMVFGFFFYCGQ